MNHRFIRKTTYVLLFSFVSLLFFGACSKSDDRVVTDAHAGNVTESMPDKAQLERDVANLFEGDEVLLRRGVEKVFALAKLREQEGNEKEAIQLYEAGLRVNASNIPCQMKFAALLEKHKRLQEAIASASIVQEMTEDETLIRNAEELLKSLGHAPKPTKAHNQIDENVEIVLIPLGTVNDRVLNPLRDMLELRMGIRFTIYPKTRVFCIGKPDRTFKTVFVEDYFRWLKERIGNDKFRTVVAELGFTEGSLDSSDSKLKFIESLLEHSGADGQKALTEFNIELNRSEKQEQYNADRLVSELQTQFPLQTKSSVKGYLAVTSEDIYARDSRFLFGNSLPGYGVMSFRRFCSDFTGEDQNRPRLVKRALKQALSSSNLVLGIPRCTNPDCARAYPHSLPELDQKPDILCSLCQERLSVYRQAAKR